MDAFYASVEQRENPSLLGQPVIVGAGSARGVVAAASYEARVFGVRSAMPGFRARQLCPHAVFLPARMDLYAEVSSAVHDVFEAFTPDIEPLALDEAFLDVSGSMHLFEGPGPLGRELKRRVKEKTSLNVSVGLGPTKLVAKVACTLGKPDGLRVVRLDEVRGLLDPLPIRRLWGVGPVMADKLDEIGIRTIGDLAHYDPSRLGAVLGARVDEMQARARGEDPSPVESDRNARSCGEENTFETDVLDRGVVASALTAHAEAVAARLRAAGLKGRTITLKIKLGTRRGTRRSRLSSEESEPIYPVLTRSRTLRAGVSDGTSIRDAAVELWDVANISEPVRLLGVSVSNLEPSGHEQLDLFSQAPKRDRLGEALDAIQSRFGKGAIGRAVHAPTKLTPSGRRR
jgi:DNA polymerase IV